MLSRSGRANIQANAQALPARRLRSSPATAQAQAARVLIGDTQALVHAGFRVLLESGRRITVAGNAATGEEAAALAHRTRPDEVRRQIQRALHDGRGSSPSRSSFRPSRTRYRPSDRNCWRSYRT